MPRERTALAGSHCAIKTVPAITSFAAIKMVSDLDKGHKERKYSKRGSTTTFWLLFFRSTVTPAVLTLGSGLSRSPTV